MAEQQHNDANEVAKKRVEQDREVLEQSRKEYAERTKGKPTPTQEENDLAAHGAHIVEHEDDGSGPDLSQQSRQRHAEAGKPGAYQTRQSTPEQRAVPRSTSQRSGE